MKFQYGYIIAAACLVMFAAVSAEAQSGGVEARISRIENEIQTLSRALFRGEMPPAGDAVLYESPPDQAARASIEVRLSQIEMDMRTLTGRVEEAVYGLNQVRDALDRKMSDLEMRVSDLEGGNTSARSFDRSGSYTAVPPSRPAPYSSSPAVASEAAAPPASPQSTQGSLGSLSVGPDGPPAVAGDAGDPAAAYEQAFALVRSQRFDEAEKAFRDFLGRYPGHSLAGNARYWLAETYYVRGQYETAARHFAEAYQNDPSGTKAPDNLLKMGMSLAGMGSVNDACVALSQLQKDFPMGASPVLSRAEQEMERLKCQTAGR